MMVVVRIPPVVNDQGNINVHKDEGCQIPIELESEDGTEENASIVPLFFISGSFRKELVGDTENVLRKILILTPTDLLNITHGANFRVVDESGLVPVVRWEGKLYKRG
jgi:hypothetical protein